MRGEIVCAEGEDCLEAFVVVEGQLIGTTTFGQGANHHDPLMIRSKDAAPGDDELSSHGGYSRSSSLASEADGGGTEMVAHAPGSASAAGGKGGASGATSRGQGQLSFAGVPGGSPSKGDGGASVAAPEIPARRREINVGHMVNVLCLVKVWERSVEKVVAAERSESYAITAEAFYSTFKDDQVREHLLQLHACAVLSTCLTAATPPPSRSLFLG
jgi:hypothetical protein